MEVKLAICGAAGIGKSCLVLQFVQRHFYEEFDPTIEDTYRKQIQCKMNLEGRSAVLLDIWDSVGDVSSFRHQCIGAIDVIILAFSIVDRVSFEEIESIYLPLYVLRNKQGKKEKVDFLILLVGTKCDMEHERVVNPLEAHCLAARHGWKYFETSAKMRVNVDEIFQTAADDLIQMMRPVVVNNKCIIQ